MREMFGLEDEKHLSGTEFSNNQFRKLEVPTDWVTCGTYFYPDGRVRDAMRGNGVIEDFVRL